jgi:serine/threonine protein kinase/tetratricopeptide (TPR) repeat protein
MTDEERLRALVAAVADGTPVDWQRAESGAQTDEERALVRQLRLIATLSEVSRTDEGTHTAEAGEPRAGLLTTAPMPDQWGPLHLRELVGSGGYGTVYRAWDPQLAREVALKLLNADRAEDPTFEQSVIAEGRRLARLHHPNVINVYGADTHEGRVGFWMEFLEGQTLKQWIDAHGPMSSREATLIGIDLCRALAAVHAAGLVHRDVKAQNVMRGPKGRTVLMDFGTGIETGEISRLAGTPLYMAPELLAGGPATPKSDLYSAGALLFYLVSGEFPVTGPSFAHIKAAHAAGSRKTVRDVRPDLPAAFVKVVDRALSSDPAARPTTAGALEAELAASLELPVETTPPPVPRPGPERTGRRPGYTLMGIAASAALIGALWATGTLPWVGGRSHETITASRVRSLAVLPLENLSGAGQDYYSDGMTDLLTTNLSKLGALRVIARGSVMRYKGSHDAHEIASALDVDALIQGSVLRDGNRIRITAQLVSGIDQSTLWAETYDRDIRDAFTLQSDLARDIARGINLSLTPKEQAGLRASAIAPRNVQAQEEYLKGWTALEPRTASAVADALTHFENAVRLDPAYAQAFASIAYAYSQEATLAKMSGEEAYGRARDAAMRALDLDSSQSAAYYALGLVQFNHDWDWAAASSSFQHAIDLDPGNADAHSQYGEFLTAQGRFAEALTEMRRAREIDPMNHVRRSGVAMVLFYLGKYPEAEAELRQILAISKNMGVAKFMLGRVYAAQGRTDEALAMFSEPDAPKEVRFLCERARVLVVAGRAPEARQLLRQIEGSPESERILDALAFVYTALGQRDTAVTLLNRAVDARLPAALWITVDPRFAPLHADPRFALLRRRIGLQEE